MTMQKSAIISPCAMWRYRLERRWGRGPTMLFIMVNPSTADAEQDDPTVRKCIGFAQRHCYGRLLVGNKFALRSTDIKGLRNSSYASLIGQDNDAHLRGMLLECDIAVAGWGQLAKLPEALRGRWKDVVRLADDAGKTLRCFGTNADKHPKHPLMTGYATPLTAWEVPWFAGRHKVA